MRYIATPVFLFILLIPNLLSAQNPIKSSSANRTETLYFADTARIREKNLEIGVAMGIARYLGDLVPDGKPMDGDLTPMGGIFVRRHVVPNLAFRAGVQVSQLSSPDLAYPAIRDFSFKTDLVEMSLQAEWDLFGKRRFRRVDTVAYSLDRYQQIAMVNVFRHSLLPYLFVGAGAISTKAKATFNSVKAEIQHLEAQVANDQLAGSQRKTNFGVLFGGGVDFDLGRNWLLGGTFGLRTSFSDYLDGVSFSANPKSYDWYWFAGLQVSYRLGKKDRDGDGIVDAQDRCPEIPGPGSSRGCPDADHDGIADRDDECPHRKGILSLSGCPVKDMDNDSVPDVDDLCPSIAGVIALRGCPDADGDGLEDRADECPKLAGLKEFHGCPDTDSDGVEDRLDSCSTLAGLAKFYGCPDTDGDGIEDRYDACPKDSGAVEFYKGCPVRDSDSDGIEDKLDPCPTIAGKLQHEGCPDTDGDGVEDRKDICPTVAGKGDNRGCPPIAKKDRQKLVLAMKAVKFKTGNAILKPESSKVLTDIAKIMVKYPGYYLQIAGHTDSQGDDAANQLLSEKRAQACADFLTGKGVAKERLLAAGFGETKPISSNKTTAGRTLNRRVEFDLVFPN